MAIQDVIARLKTAREQGAYVFTPSAIVPGSFYKPVIEDVALVEDDVYTTQGKYRIGLSGLLKLANAAGIEWSAIDSGRTDNNSDKLYVSFKAVGAIRKADGKLYPTAANYDLDLELIREELEEMYSQKADKEKKTGQAKEDYINYCVKRDWFQKRRHKLTLAESGARGRVIRSILGLQAQYSSKDAIIGKPYIMVRFVLDHQNPDIKGAMLAAAQQNMSAIYGIGSSPAPQIGHITSVQAPTQEAAVDDEEPFKTLDGGLVDFQNSDAEGQSKTLEAIAKEKNYNLNEYLAKSRFRSAVQMSAERRLELYHYLTNPGGAL